MPESALRHLGLDTFGVYVHVPFCRVRCGYCDFNTYTLTELGVPGASLREYSDTALRELDLAVEVLGEDAPAVDTIFFGGGTPTMLDPKDLGRIVQGIGERFGLAGDLEITTEANPDSVSAKDLEVLSESGFTRVSFGMQSAVPHVLRTLERTHDPARLPDVTRAARAVDLDYSLDLIYGTPGESLEDWKVSLETAISLEPQHLSAYALTVEEGTKLAAQVRRGEVPSPEDDDEAAKYELADATLHAAGYDWYEISNWATSDTKRCRHNEGYWREGDWWGVGPGAHSHVGGVRWWNVKHPSAYASRINGGLSPAAAREVLTAEQRYDERVMLGIRLVDGLPIDELDDAGGRAVAQLIADGLVEGDRALLEEHLVLTLRGRLLADTVVARLLGL
ncbi:coproporphyrinogen III oxidase [Arsenicicoccus piscis]|uniref:Heme chaperone HemW n=1 Tax=Arsenicicoccus piscis TaxID=673954 RepID=A0ABQ6HNQ2_9MICO|nr:coproporphyrinogen III oxidase [Arsenicicoccus piscis]